MRRHLWKHSIALMLAVLVPAAARAADIVLGMSVAFRGSARGLGIEVYRGARAGFDEVNDAGGINGRKIVLKAYDDGYEPGEHLVDQKLVPGTVANTITLVEKDNVIALFGYAGTPTTTRMLPLLKRYEKQDVLLFFPFSGAEPLRRPPYEPFVYNLRASFREETAGLVSHFVEIGRKRIAVFYQVDAHGRSGWDGVRAALHERGLRIAAEATYRRGTPFSASLRDQVEILRRGEPDAVISVATYAAAAAFIRDVRDAGWDVPIANVSFVGSESLLELLGTAGKASGTDYTRNLVNSQVVPSYHDQDVPAVRDYRAAVERYKPTAPAEYHDPDYQPLKYSFVSLEGYLDARLMAEILRKAAAPIARRGLRQAAESIVNLDLGIGVPVSFRHDGLVRHQGLNKVYFTVVREGRFDTLPDDGWKEWRR